MSRINDANRFSLLGNYSTPACRVGDRVRCLMRGEMEVVGLTNAPIPWPIGKRNGRKALVLYADLVQAVTREATGAVCYWWGVSQQTVRRWRLALGIEGRTEGSRRVVSEWFRKLGAARRGCRVSAETRRKMSESQRRRRRKGEVEPATEVRPRVRRRRWTGEEDVLVRALPAEEAAARTGRTLQAIYMRRHFLGLNDGRATRWQNE